MTGKTPPDDHERLWEAYPPGTRDLVLGIIGRVLIHLAENGRRNTDVADGYLTAEEAARAIQAARRSLEAQIADKMHDFCLLHTRGERER